MKRNVVKFLLLNLFITAITHLVMWGESWYVRNIWTLSPPDENTRIAFAIISILIGVGFIVTNFITYFDSSDQARWIYPCHNSTVGGHWQKGYCNNSWWMGGNGEGEATK